MIEDEPMIFLESFPGVEDVIVFDVQPAYSYSNSALRPEFKPVITLMVNGTEVPVVRNTGFCVSDKYPEDHSSTRFGYFYTQSARLIPWIY